MNKFLCAFSFCASILLCGLFLGGCGGSGNNQVTPLEITVSFLPSGQVGTAYNASLTATGRTLPFNWTLTNGALTNGLMLNAATGAIMGTPTATANNLSLTFQVKDSEAPAQSKSVTLSLTIAPATLTITTNSLPNGQVGVAYSTSLA